MPGDIAIRPNDEPNPFPSFEAIVAGIKVGVPEWCDPSDERVSQVLSRLTAVREGKRRIDLDDLMAIARAKSPRRIDLIPRNRDPVKIAAAFSAAISANNEDARIRILKKELQGVDVPMASCILAWTYPERWGVIDKRAWKTLLLAGLVTGREKLNGLGPKQWREYMPVVLRISAATGESPQRVDTWLYHAEKRRTQSCTSPRRSWKRVFGLE